MPDLPRYTAIPEDAGLYRLEDGLSSSSYLLTGGERALVIDTGWGDAGSLGETLAGLTGGPPDLALTHAHADHYANAGVAGLFDTVYLHPDDTAILPEMNALFRPELAGRTLEPGRVTPLPAALDLGGVRLEALHLPGHTPGSVCLLERERGWLFTGDAVGSGGQLWMQLPHGLPIARYADHLRRFLERLRPLESQRPLRLLGGHFTQAGSPGEPGYHPVTLDTVSRVLAVCEALIRGDAAIPAAAPTQPYQERFGGGRARIATLADVELAFLPDRVSG